MRSVLLSSELQTRLFAILARISVFVVFKYPYKHVLDRPKCAACRDLTAQTFLTLHLFGRDFTDFCINILSLENRPANGGFRVNESGWFCTILDSTLFRVNNCRWTRSSHQFCAYLHVRHLEFVEQMVVVLQNKKAPFSTFLYLK